MSSVSGCIFPFLMFFGWKMYNLYMNSLVFFIFGRNAAQPIFYFIASHRNIFTFDAIHRNLKLLIVQLLRLSGIILRNMKKKVFPASMWFYESMSFWTAKVYYSASYNRIFQGSCRSVRKTKSIKIKQCCVQLSKTMTRTTKWKLLNSRITIL